MNRIKDFIKIPFFLYMISLFVFKGNIPYDELLILFLIIAVNVYKERFSNSVFLVLVSFCLIFAGIITDRNFGILFCITVFDLVYKRTYIGLIPVFIILSCFFFNKELPYLLLTMALCSAIAYATEEAEKSGIVYKNNLDNERKLRYELEQTRAKLLAAAGETAHLTEVSERNRIAREIHDNIGHNIAGILIQLQASLKLFGLDNDKSKEILKKSIDGLSESVNLIRDTVYNIKPLEKLGVEYINNIINNFAFCPVEFRFNGDFNTLSPEHIGILAANIKEALTNASRYSNATKIEIKIDINENFTRLYIKDDGKGCKKIKEGLGLSGMRERVDNFGGSISISSEDGFMIVCIIPVHRGLSI
jgi:signal transduction histidine kinase